ncbi:cation transporter [Candidatus Kaiserbacteria bacterium]|nr:cation transporter [Candidatus Kaiserbacteria bacterium]
MGNHIQGCLYLTTGEASDCHCAHEERHYWWLAARSLASAIIQGFLSALSGSLGVRADAVHSATDGAENIVSAIVARQARFSPNEDAVRWWGAAVSTLLLVFASFWIVSETLERLREPRLIDTGLAAFGACVGFLFNLWQFIDHANVREEHKNLTHWFQWLHLVLDISTSVTAGLGVLFVIAGFPLGDTIASLAIVGIIWFLIALRVRNSFKP